MRFIYRKDGALYLIRYYLLRFKWIGAYLHRFVSSDPQHPHDHPFPFLSIILWGAYTERRYTVATDGTWHSRSKRRGWLSVAYRPAETKHVVTLIDDRPCWTLVIRGRRSRPWFFWLTPDIGVWWKDHLMLEQAEVLAEAADRLDTEGNFIDKVRGEKDRILAAYHEIKKHDPTFGFAREDESDE